jgi:hypothetical protein
MARHTPLLVSAFLVTACGFGAAPPAASPDDDASEQASAKKVEKRAKTDESKRKKARNTVALAVGDFYVYQFTGEFTDEPMTLTEKVVAKEKGKLVIDYVLERAQKMRALRIRMDPENGAVSSVVRLTADGEVIASVADYEAMLAETQLIPESNDEVLGTDPSTCLVGEDAVDCSITTYAVTVGGKEGVLSVSSSKNLPERDLGGEIVGPDGAVIYRARLVDHGNQKPSSAVAKNEGN